MLNGSGKGFDLGGFQGLCGTGFGLIFFGKGNIVPRMTQGMSPEVFSNGLCLEFIVTSTFIVRMMLRVGRTIGERVILVSFLRIRIGTDLSIVLLKMIKREDKARREKEKSMRCKIVGKKYSSIHPIGVVGMNDEWIDPTEQSHCRLNDFPNSCTMKDIPSCDRFIFLPLISLFLLRGFCFSFDNDGAFFLNG